MLIIILIVEVGRILLLMYKKMLNCRLVVDVGSDFDSLNLHHSAYHNKRRW